MVQPGVVSVLTNVGVTLTVMNVTGLSVLPANIIAVAIGSLVNFWINDRLIFRPTPALETPADIPSTGNVS